MFAFNINEYFTLSWFDVIAFLFLVFGLILGRKRGMSGELIDLAAALIMVVVPALYYEPLGQLAMQFLSLTPFWGNLLGYSVILMAIVISAGVIKTKYGSKLVGSDVFGRLEFYLGMFAGLFRHACYIIIFLSFIHARVVTKALVDIEIKKQEEALGSNFFSSYGALQMEVMYNSTVGGFIRENLQDQLIKPSTFTPSARPAGDKAWKGKTESDVIK